LVLLDGRQRVPDEGAEVIDAAAQALAVAAAVAARAAVGPVVGDRAAARRGLRPRLDGQAAPQAVAAVAALAALAPQREVVGEGAVREDQRPVIEDAAAHAVAAVGPRGAGAADRLVADERRVAAGHGRVGP